MGGREPNPSPAGDPFFLRGDVDGDGDVDLISGSAAELTVWANDGAGAFAPVLVQIGARSRHSCELSAVPVSRIGGTSSRRRWGRQAVPGVGRLHLLYTRRAV